MIIDVAITEEALFSGRALPGDAFQTLLDFLRDHSKIAMTPFEHCRLKQRISQEAPSRALQMLNESMSHFLNVELEDGLDTCTDLSSIERIPVDLAILDDQMASDLNFDHRSLGSSRRVAIAQVGWLRDCAKVREYLELANEKMIGASGLTLRQCVTPFLPLSASVDVFDSYLFDTNRSKLVWKTEVKDFIVDMMQQMKKSADINLFTVSDTREQAWMQSTLKKDLVRLLAELDPRGGSETGKLSLFVCGGRYRERGRSSVNIRRLNHDRFIQFMMRGTNKRRVIAIGRGLEGQSLPTTIRYFKSEPLSVMSHLDQVRNTIKAGIQNNFEGSAKVERNIPSAADDSIR